MGMGMGMSRVEANLTRNNQHSRFQVKHGPRVAVGGTNLVLVGGLFQPIYEKYARQIGGHLPRDRGEPPPKKKRKNHHHLDIIAKIRCNFGHWEIGLKNDP